ncbi:unnamed protein product [Caenorhabditis auriculariae]|uniref:Uncharacterized protein n=1 Tax=Caenorhabditis auriculariae TaxID=2777116 RepID=A0A8S1HR35_9PELO|nr:unnamed protein product [Caenorhabditis auriculariae]
MRSLRKFLFHERYSFPSQASREPTIAWIFFRIEPIVFLLIVLAWPHETSAADVCCKRAISSYSTCDSVPPECAKLTCTEAPIVIQETDLKANDVSYFVNLVERISTLSVIKNKNKRMTLSQVTALTHKGPGPAIFLDDAKLEDSSFQNLKVITVDDIKPYCDGEKLIDIRGSLDGTVKQQLDKDLNATLAPCGSLKTPASGGPARSPGSALPAGSGRRASNSTTCPPCADSAKLAEAESEESESSNMMIIIPSVVLNVVLFLTLAIVSFIAFCVRVKPSSKDKKAPAANRPDPSTSSGTSGEKLNPAILVSAKNPNVRIIDRDEAGRDLAVDPVDEKLKKERKKDRIMWGKPKMTDGKKKDKKMKSTNEHAFPAEMAKDAEHKEMFNA